MADVRVLLPAAESNRAFVRALTIITWYARLDVPYAPRETTHEGYARTSAVIDRVGRKSLLRLGGPGLLVESFTLIIAYPDHQESVEPILNALKEMAYWSDHATLVYGPIDEGIVWRLTGLTINVALRNEAGEVTRATADLTWTEASDAVISTSPLTGGAKPPAPPTLPKPKPKTAAPVSTGPKPSGVGTGTTSYTVRKGDTLSAIASRLLGDPSRYPEIARLNAIRNANLIYPGQVLKIPRR